MTDDAISEARRQNELALLNLALEYHQRVDGKGEGEYGCRGVTCPGVQKLFEFAKQCALSATGAAEARATAAEEQVEELKLDLAREGACGNDINHMLVAATRERDTLQVQLTAARAPAHKQTCPKWTFAACTCGLDAALPPTQLTKTKDYAS